jgi:hypothetical protein
MLTKTLLRILFSVIGRCFIAPTSHWLQGKCIRINFQRRLTVSIFNVKIVALRTLKRVTGRIFKIRK